MKGTREQLKKRNSSIELYRILATFTVIIAHFNGWFVGDMPKDVSMSTAPIPELCQIMIAAMASICVNMFILISGYFGIKLKLESLLKIILLLLFIKIPFYFVGLAYGESFSLTSFIGRFFILTQAGYFVQCYIMLMFLSPVLNSFVEKYQKGILPWTLAFLIIEFWFGCVMDVENLGFNNGYSVIHFVLMYMLARCLKLYTIELVKVRRLLYWGGVSPLFPCIILPLFYSCKVEFSILQPYSCSFVNFYICPFPI